MKTSCINHRANQPLVIIRQDYLLITDFNHTAAALLNFYEYWHNVKLEQVKQAKKFNKVNIQHGFEPEQYEGLLQYHKQADLVDGMLGLFGKNKIIESNKLLVDLGFIEITKNPNPKFKNDHTNYFYFNADNVNLALKTAFEGTPADCPKQDERLSENKQTIVPKQTNDCLKTDDGLSEIGQRIVPKRTMDCPKINNLYTEITTENTTEITPETTINDELDFVLLSIDNFSEFVDVKIEKKEKEHQPAQNSPNTLEISPQNEKVEQTDQPKKERKEKPANGTTLQTPFNALYSKLVCEYNDFLKSKQLPMVFNGGDGKALKEIIKLINKALYENTDDKNENYEKTEHIIRVFRNLLLNLQRDSFYSSRIRLVEINKDILAHFEYLKQLKNGQPKPTNSNHRKLDTDLIEREIAKLAEKF